MERVKAFLEARSKGDWRVSWIDATYVKVRGKAGKFAGSSAVGRDCRRGPQQRQSPG